MTRGSRSRRSTTSNRLTLGGVLLRLGVLAIIGVLLLVAGALLLRSLNQSGSAVDVTINPQLNPVEALTLGAYIRNNQERLNTPAGPETTTRTFEVVSGQTASAIADGLLAQGFVTDTMLFTNYLRYYGLDRELEAGFYSLSPSMTVPEIALALTDSAATEITVSIPEGWRREQIADWIDEQPAIPFTGIDFLAATGSGTPLPEGLSTAIPAEASLEGFLFPDTYRIGLGSSAENLVERMLATFEARVTPQMRTDAQARGLTLYEVVTLASIVEREAVVADERGLIASVYLNRISVGMLLQADPTVQYAQGYIADRGEWWNTALTQADYTSVDSPYNTYLYEGIPPGPIANPGLASIEAVIYAEESPYFFFRTTCDDSGRHNFAVTFEEHLANACP